MPRKLAAILYADVAGYSRLTGEDEEGTHRVLRTYLDLIASLISEHEGRVVHYAGDAVLADFGTVVDALSAATGIQREIADRNEGTDQERRVQFRIGVNLGDVIVDGEEIYGDGVNVAARLESLAEPGGICISDAVRTAVGRKLGFHYEDMGEQTVKNIAEPLRSFHVRFGAPPGPDAPLGSPAPPASRAPTLLVQPFSFIGVPGEHDYLAAAITEGIGAALAHFRDYRVIEGENRQAADYLLSGTLQVSGARVRISPQLTAAADGRKLWAEKFDRELDDVFELQDEISALVAAFLGEAIWRETAQALASKSRDQFTAMDWCYTAIEHVHRLTRDDFQQARSACATALEIDPELLLAKYVLAFTQAVEIGWGWAADEEADRASATSYTQELLLKDPTNANVHRLAARLYVYTGRYGEALAHSERSLSLNPYDGDVLNNHGLTLMQCGRASEAVPWMEKALRYNPQPPTYYRNTLVLAQFLAGDHETALENLHRSEGSGPYGRFVAIAVLHACGKHAEAAAEVERLLARRTDASLRSAVRMFSTYRDPTYTEAIVAALREAGVPE